MDDIFLLFMLLAIGFAIYFFIFNRQMKNAFTALIVAVSSFVLFGLATDLQETTEVESYSQDGVVEWFNGNRKRRRHHHDDHHHKHRHRHHMNF